MTDRSQATGRTATPIVKSAREPRRATIATMPKARNTSTGPNAAGFILAAHALKRVDKTRDAVVADFHKWLVAAVDDPNSPMSFAEAARLSGYTREHLSKLYARLKRPPEKPKPKGRPRKATPPHDLPA